jgi:phospholipase C
VIDDTDPATVDHTGNGTAPTDGQLVPNYKQLGFRVPTIVVCSRARAGVVHDGPFEHTSTLKMIESVFGLHSLTARDADPWTRVRSRGTRYAIPSPKVPSHQQSGTGPASDAAAVCTAASVQSVSPPPGLQG